MVCGGFHRSEWGHTCGVLDRLHHIKGKVDECVCVCVCVERDEGGGGGLGGGVCPVSVGLGGS